MEADNETDKFDVAWATVKALSTSFLDNRQHYIDSGLYQETEVRSDFIDKFFIALGWDVNHEKQRDPYRQEVKLERTTDKNWSGKADYAFYLSPLFTRAKFLVEAKRPQQSIISPDNCFQTIRYGWPQGTPISVLTDFSHLHILDTRFKPNIDSATTRVIKSKSWSCEDWLVKEKFSEVYWLLSREAVAQDSIARCAEQFLPTEQLAAKQYSLFKQDTKDFDDDFLDKLDEWREELARAFNKADSDLTSEQLTECVQVTLDRLIFIRFLEDKTIEQSPIISRFGLGGKTQWHDFVVACHRLDQIYNGTVFKTHRVIDAKGFYPEGVTFAEICDELTDEHTPYNFNLIPIEILGRIYERFLGKIVLAKNDRIKVVEKENVRKAGGVYYTPDYIVAYMVENSLGKLTAGNSATEILKLRIIDTSCGSGSFLIGAFTHLMQRVLAIYRASPKGVAKKRAEERDGELHLTMEQKREILLQCIYGVDIDPQAVSVAQLSLYLKLMEDETTYSARHQQIEMGAALLPSLNDNIVEGNSLVTALDGEDTDLFSVRDLSTLKALDFHEVFSDVFKQGGFDLVIGNPPYIKEYVNRNAFDHVRTSPYYQGKMDIWYLFACRALDWLKPDGLLAFIATNNWVTNSGAKKLRRKVRNETKIEQLIDFGEFKVFRDAAIQTMILITQKTDKPKTYEIDFRRLKGKKPTFGVAQALLQKQQDASCEYLASTIERTSHGESSAPLTFSNSKIQDVLKKLLKKRNFQLDAKKEIAQGIVAPQDFLNARGNEKLGNRFIVGQGIFCLSRDEERSLKLNQNEKDLLKPYYTTAELGRYFGSKRNDLWVIYTDSRFKKPKSMSPFPHLKKHLDQFKKVITSHNAPYGLHRARDEKYFVGEKIISLRKCEAPTFTYTDFPCYVSQTFNVIKTTRIDQLYLTGLLNSRIVKGWLRHKGKMQGGNFQIDSEPLLAIPLHVPPKAEQTAIASLVKRIIEALKEQSQVRTNSEMEKYARLARQWDNDIQSRLQRLYGITDDELKLLDSEAPEVTQQ